MSVCAQTAFHVQEKPSLRAFGEKLQHGEEITQLYKSTALTAVAAQAAAPFPHARLATILKDNAGVWKEWMRDNQDSIPFLRGEIDDEQVLNRIIVALQLAILQAREKASEKKWSAIPSVLGPWFNFAADLPFEEASLISLRLANLLRSLLLDELEGMEKLASAQIAQSADWLTWADGLRSSWPIDRVIITEAKKVFSNRPLFTAQQVAMALQKNPYQTAAAALQVAQGPKTPELKMLEKLWRQNDIEAMKTEVHRLSALRVRLAAQIYLQKYKKAPISVEQLVEKNLLTAVPMDYNSGKPFTLPEAALH